MKVWKVLGIILGVAVVLLGVVIALALTPAVQTWAMRKAVANQPGMTIEVGRVAAGTSAADLQDVRVVKDGMVITMRNANANYSAWEYLSHHRIDVDQLTASDVVVDLRNVKPAADSASQRAPYGKGEDAAGGGRAPSGQAQPARTTATNSSAKGSGQPFNGVLNEMKLPYDVHVGRLALQGKALLPNEQTVNFDVKGGGIQTGEKGQIEYMVDFADATPKASLRALHANGTVGIHIATDRRVHLVELNTTANAESAGLPPDTVKLEARLEQSTPGGDETYAVRAGLLKGTEFTPLLTSDARFQPPKHELAGTWQITVRTDQIASLLAGLKLPDTTADGKGTFAWKSDTNAATANGELTADAARLEKIAPELGVIGRVRTHLTFDGGFADNTARLEKFQLEMTTADGKQIVQAQALQRIAFSTADQRVSLADPKADLARIAVRQVPLAWAQPFAKPMTFDSGELSLELSVTAEPDGSRIFVRPVSPVTLRNVTVRNGAQKLVENANVSVSPTIDYSAQKITADLADLKVSLPAGDAINGKVHADVTQPRTAPVVAFSGNIDAKLVAALKPYLPLDPGPMTATTKFDGRFANNQVRLTQATTTVNRDNGGQLLDFNLQQPVDVDLKKLSFATAKPNETLARVKLGEVPLAWAEKFMPNSKFGGTFNGATLEVSARSADDLSINTTAPVEVRGADVTLNNQALAQKLDLTMELSANKRGDAVTYDVRKLEVKQGNASLATVAAKGQANLGKKLSVSAQGNVDADVAALMRQPAAASFATLSRGRLTTNFDANYGDTIRAKAKLTVKNLVAKQNNQPLGDLEVDLDADVKPDGSGKITAPLTLTNGGRKSDLTLDGTLGRTGSTFSFNGRITSAQLIVDDFQPLAALAPASPAQPGAAAQPGTTVATRTAPGVRAPIPTTPAPRAPVATTPGPVKPDTVAVWNAVAGKIDVDLKKIQYGKDYTISGVRGAATITSNRLGLDSLEGKFKDNPFKVTAAVTFTPNHAMPYSLSGNADVKNVDVGALLAARTPNEKPMLETLVSVAAKMNGNGATLANLGERVYGTFDVTGSKGVLRALGKKGQAVSAVGSIIGIIGAARGSDTTSAVGDLARAWNEMEFDQFKTHVERGADLNIKVTTVEFISPSMRLTGTADIPYQPGEFQNWPLQGQFQLAGKEYMAQLLNRAGLLGGQQDDKGYYTMNTSFQLRGTVGQPDSSDLWRIIGAAGARAAASALGGFLGR